MRFVFQKSKIVLIFTLLIYTISGFSQSKRVLIKTTLGNIKLELYDDTPVHQTAFLNLVHSKYFDGTLFYRVIDQFLIQGGSSDSRNAPAGKLIGYGSSEAEIKAEIKDKHIHKYGALCAPRQPEDINFLKKSDVSQFYISTGKVYSMGRLDTMELSHNRPIYNKIVQTVYVPIKKRLAELKVSNPQKYNEELSAVKTAIDLQYGTEDILKFSKLQREIYTTVGGNPLLDGKYTVFGEVIDGMDVVKKIEKLKTDKNNRPFKNIVMEIIEL